MISIEIPVLQDGTIRQVLDSIVGQTYQDFEVIIVSPSKPLLEKLQKYNIKGVHANVGLLKARYLAHKEAKGAYELILDDSRILDKNCLKNLSRVKEDMAIIVEKEIGRGLWVNLANLDKEIIIKYNSDKLDPTRGFLQPRYYKNVILNHTFSAMKKKIDSDIFNRIVSCEDQLIFYESYNYSKSVKLIKKGLIYHFGDKSMVSILKKYFRYGRTYKLIKDTKYSNLVNIGKKRRTVPTLDDSIKLNILYTVRAAPFMLGYILP
jgi:glycosyltransferase involved in cell wall biosynthesis